MKRFPEIERKILLTVEQLPAGRELFAGELDGYTDRHADVVHSINMLRQDGALRPARPARDEIVEGDAITPRGYEVLRKIDTESGWQKVIAFGKSKGTDVATSGVTAVVVEFIKSMMG